MRVNEHGVVLEGCTEVSLYDNGKSYFRYEYIEHKGRIYSSKSFIVNEKGVCSGVCGSVSVDHDNYFATVNDADAHYRKQALRFLKRNGHEDTINKIKPFLIKNQLTLF